MRNSFLPLLGAALLLTACDNTPKTDELPATIPAPASASNGISSATVSVTGEAPIYTVGSVVIGRPGDGNANDVVVRATGTTRSGGWKNARLVAATDNNASERSFRFLATAPTGPATSALTDIEVESRIANLPAGIKTVRVIGETNAVSAPVP